MKRALIVFLVMAVFLLSLPAAADGETEPDTHDGEVQFSDIQGHWGEQYIKKAAALGLFTGVEDGTFRPHAAVTRSQFVTVLWRMAGKPSEEEPSPFADVPEQQWYSEAIAWAYARGLVNGRSAGSFGAAAFAVSFWRSSRRSSKFRSGSAAA